MILHTKNAQSHIQKNQEWSQKIRSRITKYYVFVRLSKRRPKSGWFLSNMKVTVLKTLQDKLTSEYDEWIMNNIFFNSKNYCPTWK